MIREPASKGHPWQIHYTIRTQPDSLLRKQFGNSINDHLLEIMQLCSKLINVAPMEGKHEALLPKEHGTVQLPSQSGRMRGHFRKLSSLKQRQATCLTLGIRRKKLDKL